MSGKKKITIVSSAVSAVLVLGIVLFLIFGRGPDDYAQGWLPVYFFSASQGQLVAELRQIPQADSLERINAALRHFFDGPVNVSLSPVWPFDVEFRELITDIYIEENEMVVLLSELYDEIPPLDEAFFRTSFTLTMVGLPYVNSVKFRTTGYNGTEWVESAKTISNSPYISSERRTAEEFTLYFADESGGGLIAVNYFANDVNMHLRTQRILEILIEGQSGQGIMPLIPPETRVRTVIISPDAQGIYVDLSPEFHSRFGGTTAQAHMMLQAITHTVLDNNRNPHLHHVFFLINSERWDEFHGITDFNLGFSIDESMMLGYVPAVEYVYEE